MILTPNSLSNLPLTILEFSYAEFGSALEMLAAAKYVKSPNLKVGYINHALDEYRHAELLNKILAYQLKKGFEKNYKFNVLNVISKGYVDKKGFLVEKLNLKKFVEFVFSNEFLAKKSFDMLIKKINHKQSNKILKKIINEEDEHANSSIETLNEIMKDEYRHWGYAKKFYEKKFPSSKLKLAFYREKLKNRFRQIYLKNFLILDKIFNPFVKFLLIISKPIIANIQIPNNNKNKNNINLLKSNFKTVI